jgi:hypothetical protein
VRPVGLFQSCVYNLLIILQNKYWQDHADETECNLSSLWVHFEGMLVAFAVNYRQQEREPLSGLL